MKVSIFVHELQKTLFVYIISAEERASTAADVDAVHDARKAKLANEFGSAWTMRRACKDFLTQTLPLVLLNMQTKARELWPFLSECMTIMQLQVCIDMNIQSLCQSATDLRKQVLTFLTYQ